MHSSPGPSRPLVFGVLETRIEISGCQRYRFSRSTHQLIASLVQTSIPGCGRELAFP